MTVQMQARLDAMQQAIVEAMMRGESQDVIDAMESRYETAMQRAIVQK